MRADKWEEVILFANKVQEKIKEREEVFLDRSTQIKKSYIDGDSWVIIYYEENPFHYMRIGEKRSVYRETILLKEEDYRSFKSYKNRIKIIKRESII